MQWSLKKSRSLGWGKEKYKIPWGEFENVHQQFLRGEVWNKAFVLEILGGIVCTRGDFKVHLSVWSLSQPSFGMSRNPLPQKHSQVWKKNSCMRCAVKIKILTNHRRPINTCGLPNLSRLHTRYALLSNKVRFSPKWEFMQWHSMPTSITHVRYFSVLYGWRMMASRKGIA